MTEAALQQLAPAVLDDVRQAGSIQTLEVGQVLFDQDHDSYSVYVVVEGILKLILLSRSGGTSLVALRGRGSLVGHHGALDGKARLAGAQAVIDCTVLCIPCARFNSLVRRLPDLALAIMAELSGQLRDTTHHIAEMSDEHAHFLIARRLVQLAVEPMLAPLRVDEGHPIVVQSPLSQSDLAAWAGVSARSGAVALAAFREAGLIRTSRLRIEIVDLDGLRVEAGLLGPT